MYILIVDLIQSPEVVSPYADLHRQWVKEQFTNGIFCAAGAKKNKLGGVILAKSIDKNTLVAIVAGDPYIIEELAEYRIIDFDCGITINELNSLTTL